MASPPRRQASDAPLGVRPANARDAKKRQGPFLAFAIPLAIVAGAAFLVAVRALILAKRERRFWRGMQSAAAGEYVVEIYGRVLPMLAMLRKSIRAGETPNEYSARLAIPLYNDAPAFALLTELFNRARYGGEALGEVEREAALAFFRTMDSRVRHATGWLGYFWRRYLLGRLYGTLR
jgi:hypothetical protein